MPFVQKSKPSTASSAETIYEVERILSARLRKGDAEYLVRWSGFDASWDSWEPLSGLADAAEMVKKFDSENKSPAKPRSKSRGRSASKGRKASPKKKSVSPKKKAGRSRSRARSKTPTQKRAKSPRAKSTDKTKIPKPTTPASKSRSPGRPPKSAIPSPSVLRSRIAAVVSSPSAGATPPRSAARVASARIASLAAGNGSGSTTYQSLGLEAKPRRRGGRKAAWYDVRGERGLQLLLLAVLIVAVAAFSYYNRVALSDRLTKLLPKRR